MRSFYEASVRAPGGPGVRSSPDANPARAFGPCWNKPVAPHPLRVIVALDVVLVVKTEANVAPWPAYAPGEPMGSESTNSPPDTVLKRP